MTDPSPLWPDPTPEATRRIPEGLILGAAALLAALFVVGALIGWDRFGSDGGTTDAATPIPEPDDQGTSGGTTTPPSGSTTVAPSTTEPETDSSDDQAVDGGAHAACPADVPTEVCDAAAFVETQRGRPFKEFPTVEFIDQDAFAERLLRDFEDSRDDLDISTEIWRSLGWIEPDVDLYDALITSYEIGAVGVYFTDTKELYIEGTELNLYTQLIVVHELTHAFDDQWFDLGREEYEESEDEIGYGFSAVVEGNASRVEAAWRDQLSPGEQDELDRLEGSALSVEDIDLYLSLPLLLLQFQISPYQDGELLVADIASRGGEDAVDQALLNPPTTSEQVLHPELFQEGVALLPLDVPDAEGEIIDESVMGELGFDLWLGDAVGDGWGSDRTVTWRTANGACTRIAVVADTAGDADEFEVAADLWADGDPGRAVERVGDVVEITGCYSTP